MANFRLKPSKAPKQQGFMLAYIMLLIALATVAMSGFSFMNKGVAGKTYMDDTQNAIIGQIETIRGQILLCGLVYPTGNNATTFNIKYPGGSAVNVSTLTCPGNPAANKSLWTGNDGTFLPAVPSGFTGWIYTNDATGIKLVITSNAGTLANNVLANVAAKFIAAESTFAANALTVWIVKS